MDSDSYAIVVLPGSRSPRVLPIGGRERESFEAYCATCGAAVIGAYLSIEEAVAAIRLPIDDRFAAA